MNKSGAPLNEPMNRPTPRPQREVTPAMAPRAVGSARPLLQRGAPRWVLAFALCAAAIAGSAGAPSPTWATPLRSVSPELIGELLSELGLVFERTLDADKDPLFMFRIGQIPASLSMYRDGEEPIYTSIRLRADLPSEMPNTLERVNQWNVQQRFSTAYMEPPRTAVVKAYLDVAGGVERANLRNFLAAFVTSSSAFRTHLGQSP
jgi:hypothetical protein